MVDFAKTIMQPFRPRFWILLERVQGIFDYLFFRPSTLPLFVVVEAQKLLLPLFLADAVFLFLLSLVLQF
jgi:hypothetical protein